MAIFCFLMILPLDSPQVNDTLSKYILLLFFYEFLHPK